MLDLYDINRLRSDFVLGRDAYLFLGDNRSNSTDSRIRRNVPAAAIIGEVVRVPNRLF